jgi:type IV secretion system protein VirB5
MKSIRVCKKAAIAVLLLSGMFPAHAQWAVVDVGAIAQLVRQVTTMRQQLETARNQLQQARSQYDAMTGARGMERLLSGVDRNYLPPDWHGIEATINGTGGRYSALAGELQRLVASNAILTPAQISNLSADTRTQLQTARQSVALKQATSQQAFSVTSDRFDSLNELVEAIPRAQDQKAVLDLQARISAEQTLLQNEQTKILLLSQAAEAAELARRQRAKELAIANIGSLRRLPAMGLRE